MEEDTIYGIKPQAGFQKAVLDCTANLAIIGGGAGASKTYSMLLKAMKWVHYPQYRGIFFRRLYKDVFGGGGLWDEASKLFAAADAVPHFGRGCFTFPSGAIIYFGSIKVDKDVHRYQGQQFASISFDELTHFTPYMFWYMLSRNRAKSPLHSHMIASCNPEVGWVKELVQPFLNSSDYPDSEKVKKLKYFMRNMDTQVFEWADKKEKLSSFVKNEEEIKSFTFIPGKLEDNPILLRVNPGYKASLMMLPEQERYQLLEGWWGAVGDDKIFKKEWFQEYLTLPSTPLDYYFVTVDTAAKTGGKNDYSVMCYWGYRYPEHEGGVGKLYLLDMNRGRYTYLRLKEELINFVEMYIGNLIKGEVYIEDMNVGTSLINELPQVVSCKVSAIKRKPKDNKLNRAFRATFMPEKGGVSIPAQADFKDIFIKEVCSFNGDMTQEHDDITDNLMDAVDIACKKAKVYKASKRIPSYDANNLIRKTA